MGRCLWLALGLLLGAGSAALYFAPARIARAGNDRYEDFIMCTGPVTFQAGFGPQGGNVIDGVWLLDYRGGKLLAGVIDRVHGRIGSWAEVDLVNEFGILPKQDVHFMMTTGTVSQGQAALYVAETTTGKFGVYTMGPRPDNAPGIAVRRHDLQFFRKS
jgi:hypothetical protein